MNGRDSREWLVPLTGVAAVVVVIVSFIVSGEPKDADHPAGEIAEWYIDNKDSVQIGAIIGAAGAVLLVFFGAYMRKVLRAAEGNNAMLPILPLIGLTIVAVGGAIDNTILFATAEAADDITPESVQTLQALWDNDFIPFQVGILVFLWSVGLSVIRTGVLPKWLGWVAIVLGVLGVTPIGFLAFAGGALWILVVSILLSVRLRSAPAAA
jgi:hypothetical protein